MMKVRHYVEFAESLSRQEFDKKFEEDVTKYTSESELPLSFFLLINVNKCLVL